jgi:branched-subunit amino acid transport protein
VSWAALLALAAGGYALKAVGPLALGDREPSPRVGRVLSLLAVPLLAALIVVQTLGDGDRLVLDARVPALAVAAVCVWRRAPFLVTVLVAAGVAAALRAV